MSDSIKHGLMQSLGSITGTWKQVLVDYKDGQQAKAGATLRNRRDIDLLRSYDSPFLMHDLFILNYSIYFDDILEVY